jgi:hypothetical protein
MRPNFYWYVKRNYANQCDFVAAKNASEPVAYGYDFNQEFIKITGGYQSVGYLDRILAL